LLFCQHVSILTIHRFKPQYILSAKTGDRALDGGRATGTLADLRCQFSRKWCFLTASGASQLTLSSGSYCIGSDNVGTLSLTTSDSNTSTLEVAIGTLNSSNVATEGRMILTDDYGTSASGHHGMAEFSLQSSSAFASGKASIDGGYAFVLKGEDTLYSPAVVGGILEADGSGTIDTSTVDKLSTSGIKTKTAVTGTYSTPDFTTGRFTMALTGVTSGTTNFVGYMVDAKHSYLMTSDSHASNPLASGVAYKQQQTSYSYSNLVGSFVIYSQGYDAGGSLMTNVMQGTCIDDDTDNCTVNASDMKEGSNDVVSDDATGTSTLTPDSTWRFLVNISPVYLFDTTEGLELDAGSTGNYTVVTGRLTTQTSSLTYTDLAGSYFLEGLSSFSAEKSDQIGVATMDSTGAFTGTFYEAGAGSTPASDSVTATLDTINSYGRFSVLENSVAGETCYAVSVSQGVCFDLSTGKPTLTVLQK